MTPEFDVARKLKETLFEIVNHSSNHRTDAYYGGVLVDTPDGPKLACLRLTFESTEPKPKRGMPPYTETEAIYAIDYD